MQKKLFKECAKFAMRNIHKTFLIDKLKYKNKFNCLNLIIRTQSLGNIESFFLHVAILKFYFYISY